MTTKVTVAANAILGVLHETINAHCPFFLKGQAMQWAPSFAGQCADAAVKALDKIDWSAPPTTERK